MFNGVKVFGATLARDRAVLGETVTAWLQQHPEVEIVDKVVTQSSDREYHCLAITLFYRGAVEGARWVDDIAEGCESKVTTCEGCPLLAEGCYCAHPDSDVDNIWNHAELPPQACPLRQRPIQIRLEPSK